jgi:hypothetical protein
MTLVIALLAQILAPAAADTTSGGLSGTVTSQKSGAPIPNVAVTAASPSGTYNAKTDAKGFFSLLGLPPDTYTISFKVAGREPQTVNGVTVNAQQTTTLSQVLNDDIKTIGRVVSRTPNSAYQPTQPQDTYSVNPQQIDTILGKAKATSETNLLIALPGASLDSSGYPVLRGGRENEEGFQFEGIDYTDAFTNQFVNSLALNGVGGFQLTPGTGDASTGNTGTGTINITLERGKRPAFGTLDFEARGVAYGHQFSGDYGFATPDGKLSNYVSFVGQRNGGQVGYKGTDLVSVGATLSQQYSVSNDLVDNFIYKFGKDNNQSIQLVYQNQLNNFYIQGAPGTIENYASGDKFVLTEWSAITGYSPALIGSLIGFDKYQTRQVQSLASNNRSAETYYQPNQTFKFQYSNNLNATTFLTAKLYRVLATTTFDFPYAPGSYFFEDAVVLQGGNRTGGQIDITKQLGSQHLLALGVKREYLQPVDSYRSQTGGFGNTVFDAGFELADFISVANGGTGYLSQYFPNGVPRVPNYDQGPIFARQDLSYYLTDTFNATDRLKFQFGVRVDSTDIQLPQANAGAYLPASGLGYSSGYYLPTSTGVYANGTIINGQDVSGMPNPALDVYNTGGKSVSNPIIPEPRFSFSYQLDKQNAIRASYGRAVQLAPISYYDYSTPRSTYNAFNGIPATLNVCGPTGDRQCATYADQLYWENQLTGDGVPLQPIKPAQFNNFDASFEHDFGHGISLKVSPYYRISTNAFALTQSQKYANGVPLLNPDGSPLLNAPLGSNLGLNRTTGVEFYATKEAAYGFSGQISATYINEFSNVIPLSTSEDFFPSIPPASLGLGNQYRVGFISPFSGAVAAAYRFRNGLKINPIFYYSRGYPYGNGAITSSTINGKYVNLPQTNVTNATGTTAATNYVDPQNPGSVFKPNVAATRGTPEGASPGTYLTAPRLQQANLDIELAPKGSHTTFGVLISNLFDNVYGLPSLNGRYQPVANGISGPKTGTSSLTQQFGPSYGYTNYIPSRFGYDPYVITPNGTPITFRAYVQLSL